MTPRENVYTCRSCGALLVTRDVDAGVTPMFMTCGSYNPEGCGETMHSAMYPKGPRPAHIPEPTHEWYRPRGDELTRLRKRPSAAALWEHVRKGGLLIRKIGEQYLAEPAPPARARLLRELDRPLRELLAPTVRDHARIACAKEKRSRRASLRRGGVA